VWKQTSVSMMRERLSSFVAGEAIGISTVVINR
jgi:hypothetical protein